MTNRHFAKTASQPPKGVASYPQMSISQIYLDNEDPLSDFVDVFEQGLSLPIVNIRTLPYFFFLILEIVFPIDLEGLSMSLMAKLIASLINAFTFGFR